MQMESCRASLWHVFYGSSDGDDGSGLSEGGGGWMPLKEHLLRTFRDTCLMADGRDGTSFRAPHPREPKHSFLLFLLLKKFLQEEIVKNIWDPLKNMH